jgi:hypothetical protein
VAGSPERLKATAPTTPGLRESALAFIPAAFGLKHSTALPAAAPSAATKGRGTVGHLAHLGRPCPALLTRPPAIHRDGAVQPDTQGLRVWLPPRSDRRVRPALPAGTSEACRPLGLAAPSRSAPAAPRRYCQCFRSCSTIPRRNGLRIGAKHRGGAAAADVGPRA